MNSSEPLVKKERTRSKERNFSLMVKIFFDCTAACGKRVATSSRVVNGEDATPNSWP